MIRLKSITGLVGRLAQAMAPQPAEPERALTEDDVATDRYLQRQQASRATKRQSAAA